MTLYTDFLGDFLVSLWLGGKVLFFLPQRRQGTKLHQVIYEQIYRNVRRFFLFGLS